MKYLPPIQKNFNDVCGIPLDGGRIEVFLHGTTTPASLYSDADGTAYAPNPYKVNVLGDVTFFVDADTELDYFVYDDLGYLRASYSKVKVNPCENGGGSGPSGDVEWDYIKNKPSTFPPSAHRHNASEIDNLPSVPTKVSELENDKGFITFDDVPSPVFKAVYNTTTFAEVKAAIDAGQSVICDVSGYEYCLSKYDDTSVTFSSTYKDNNGNVAHDNAVVTANGWNAEGVMLATKDYVDGLVGNVESLLAAL